MILLVLLISRFLHKNKSLAGGFKKKITKFITEYYAICILVVSSIATLGSLTFSEVLNFNPCILCWYQRIFMYPLVIISGIALLTFDAKAKKYILSLSVIGFLIALYHVLLQFFPEILKCTDEVAKCSTKQFATFGYITIPVMSLTAFLILILISFLNSNSSKK